MHKRWINGALMLGQRRRRWANMNPESAQCRTILLTNAQFNCLKNQRFSTYGGD